MARWRWRRLPSTTPHEDRPSSPELTTGHSCLAEADLGGGINDLAMTDDGQVFFATDLGLAALSFRRATDRLPEERP